MMEAISPQKNHSSAIAGSSQMTLAAESYRQAMKTKESM